MHGEKFGVHVVDSKTLKYHPRPAHICKLRINQLSHFFAASTNPFNTSSGRLNA